MLEVYIYIYIQLQKISNLRYPQQEIYISSQKYIYPARDTYIQLEIYISSKRYISPARDIYLQLQIDIYLRLGGHISPARDRHLDCIQKFDFVEHYFQLRQQLYKSQCPSVGLSASNEFNRSVMLLVVYICCQQYCSLDYQIIMQ